MTATNELAATAQAALETALEIKEELVRLAATRENSALDRVNDSMSTFCRGMQDLAGACKEAAALLEGKRVDVAAAMANGFLARRPGAPAELASWSTEYADALFAALAGGGKS